MVNHFFRENPLTYDGRGRAVCPGPANSAPQKSLKKTSQKVVDLSKWILIKDYCPYRERTYNIKVFIFPYTLLVKDAGNADVMERLKILAEFQGVSEYQVFMASMTKERDIKQRIKDLMRYELITASIFWQLPFKN